MSRVRVAPSSWRFLRWPHRDEGQALALFAGGLVIFLGFVAMSIDVGRFVWARTQMQAAVDAAALAAAQSMPSTADATQQATDYWIDNSGFVRSQATAVQFSVTFPPGNKKVLVTGEASLPTWFARFVGFRRWTVAAEGEAEAQVVDAVVVLDRSGSMCWDSHGPNGNYVSQVRLKRAITSSVTTIEVIKNDASRPLASAGLPARKLCQQRMARDRRDQRARYDRGAPRGAQPCQRPGLSRLRSQSEPVYPWQQLPDRGCWPLPPLGRGQERRPHFCQRNERRL